MPYKVFVTVNKNGFITAVNSGIFLSDTTGWVQVDEGEGDKYAHAQGNYLDKPLMDENGCYNYKLVDGKPVERTNAEKQADTVYINRIRAEKLVEVSDACQRAIYAGVDVSDTKGVEHFSLTIEDQTNLSALAAAIMQGAASVPYHADGQLCRQFTAAEFTEIYSAAKAYITRQTTLCNHLNVWIKRCTTVEEVSAITYSSLLPDDLQANFNSVLGITA